MGLRPKQLEAVGVLIVLFAALWEIMTLREILGWLNEWQFSQLNWRITHIWSAIGTSRPPCLRLFAVGNFLQFSQLY
jgi:hypothetical protein